MAIRECDCKEFQDSGHTDECNEHYKPKHEITRKETKCPTCGNDAIAATEHRQGYKVTRFELPYAEPK